jgi:spore germination cell wall hydrolase CwlJ-like protein
MKVKLFLISLAVVASSNVLADVAEVKAEVSFKDQMIYQTTNFVESAVNMIKAPFLSEKDLDCLARNIFYEAGSEPTEGKVAVGIVTINRSQDPRYPSTICGVVHQKTVVTVPQKTTEVKTVGKTLLTPGKEVTEIKTTWVQKVVYQFSWVPYRSGKIKSDDPRWIESRAIAEELSKGGYSEYQLKYGDAMNFHNTSVRPGWKLRKIGRVGNHIFYEGAPLQGG